MKWTEDLSVGIKTIDEQHMELFYRINKLVEAIKQHRCKDEIDGTLKFLDDYARFHFSEEERRMEESGYQGLAEHKKHHATYLANIEDLKREAALPRVKGSSYDLSVTTNQVIVDWIVDHIMKLDRAFGVFIKSQKQS